MILNAHGQEVFTAPELAAAESWARGTTLSQGSIFNQILPFHQPNAELPNPLDFNGLVNRFYRRNAIVYSAVRLISGSASDPEFQAGTVDSSGVFQPDDPNSDPLAMLIRNPNPAQDAYEFLEMLLIHLFTTGNAFVHLVRSPIGIPLQMELIRPDIMKIVPVKAPTGERVARYFVEAGGDKIEIPANDVIQFKLPDALDEFWGLSPLFVLSRLGDIDDQSVDFLRAYFLNKGVPSGMLTVQGRVQDPDREAMKLNWQQQFQGSEGWHKIPVMDQGVAFQQLSTGLKDMDLNPIFNQTETRIAMVFGVPPILLGTNAGLERSTFSNFKESRRGFWQETLVPLYTRLQRRFTRMLAQKEFGMNRMIQFDLSKVAGLQQSQQELRDFALEGWRRSLLTRDEALQLVDMDPSASNGDSVLLGTSAIYVPLAEATTFKSLVGDVATDLLEEERDEIAEENEPEPTPTEQRRKWRNIFFGEGGWYDSFNPSQDRLWNPVNGDCIAHEVFACADCQAAMEASACKPGDPGYPNCRDSEPSETLDHIAIAEAVIAGDEEAREEYILLFPPEFVDSVIELIDLTAGLDVENGVNVLVAAIGESPDGFFALFDVAEFLQGQGKTPDEIANALRNAKVAIRENE
jgi:HK97 family phage portal protein